MLTRRLIAAGAALGLLLAAAIPVTAHGPNPGPNRYGVTVLVTGPASDPDLVNAWGLTRLAASPWWVADNGTNMSTIYLADGSKAGLKVAIPPTGDGTPTGAVSNPDFGVLDSEGNPVNFHGDRFLFASEAGVITGWRPALGTTAETANDDFVGDAVFKGLAFGTADVGDGPQDYLYATDFHNRRIDVFDRTFAAQTWSGAFVDPGLPTGYGPFGIQNLNEMLFVTYARTQPGSNDELAGVSRGVVDAFATDGTFLGRVATHGLLNAPWGLAMAPTGFGRFSGDLIVGNFGDGTLNAFRWDGQRWHHDGRLMGVDGEPIVVDGLWGLGFGSGGPTDAARTNNGLANSLYFTAGPDEESAGAFGTITVAP